MKGARPLSPGEVELSRSMFGGAIDTARVHIVQRKWWPFQPRGIVMAPTGNIHFHPASNDYRDDFALAPLSLQGLFVHEMTHVLQSQQRGRYYLPLMRHPFCRYRYRLRDDQAFDAYGLEQQAEIMRHLFLATHGIHLADQVKLAALGERLPFRPA